MSTSRIASVSKKFLMALTGLGLVGFVITHLLGNLALYRSSGDHFNSYANFLHSQGPLLLAAEVGLLGLILLHAATGLMIKKDNLGARPVGYRTWKSKGGQTPSTISSRNMAITGTILLLFIAIHVWQFRFGANEDQGYVATVAGVQMRDLYRLVVETFKNPAMAGAYVVAMIFLGLHLRHGLWSMFQSLGWTSPNTTRKIWIVGGLLGAVLAAGFLFIPVWIYFHA
jgi:succinate dehydrogenase / fumarate reductase cytochrome b subunit